MSSLKGYIPGLARVLAVTPGAIYERQRVLVRAGIFDAGDGRGPGSGVRATPDAIAVLLICMLATERLTDSADRVKGVAGAKPEMVRRCPLTRQSTFAKAFGTVLFNTGLADRIVGITVSRTADRAQIQYFDPGDSDTIHTVTFAGSRPTEPGMCVSATLTTAVLQQIAADAQSIIFDEISEGGRSP